MKIYKENKSENINFLIVSFFTEGYKNKADRLIKSLDKFNLNYKIFILPSSFEGNPKVVLEAMSRGALVIAKDNKNTSEIIKNGFNGVIYQKDNEILNKIQYYLNNKSEWERITKNAYASIIKKNQIEKAVENELLIYRS